MKKVSKIYYQITERELIRDDYSNIFKVLEKLTLNREKSYGCLQLNFYDVDFERNPIYLDRAKCNFIKAIYKKYGHLFYFIEGDTTKMELFYCIVDVKLKNTLVVPKYNIKMSKLVDKIKDDILRYGIQIGDERGALESIKFIESLKKRHFKVRYS